MRLSTSCAPVGDFSGPLAPRTKNIHNIIYGQFTFFYYPSGSKAVSLIMKLTDREFYLHYHGSLRLVFVAYLIDSQSKLESGPLKYVPGAADPKGWELARRYSIEHLHLPLQNNMLFAVLWAHNQFLAERARYPEVPLLPSGPGANPEKWGHIDKERASAQYCIMSWINQPFLCPYLAIYYIFEQSKRPPSRIWIYLKQKKKKVLHSYLIR
ncbi:Uncharacterized protein HZ326_27118 [Fusarium oxysporum f. sp. albedinis]|nr:Uncharacterized protein HZ326_27118 [Fusarium oxysporum f. sp. albedinis]